MYLEFNRPCSLKVSRTAGDTIISQPAIVRETCQKKIQTPWPMPIEI